MTIASATGIVHSSDGLETGAALTAWLRYLRGDNGKVDDPLASTLQALWERGGAGGLIDGLFGSAGLFADTWIAGAPEKAELLKQVRM